MKTIHRLNEKDIKSILSHHYGVDDNKVKIWCESEYWGYPEEETKVVKAEVETYNDEGGSYDFCTKN